MKLWSGRFSKNTLKAVDEYNASIEFDHQLALFDIQGSLAHVKMLGACNILPEQTVAQIISGLQQIRETFLQGEITWSIDDEDVHMNIERLLQQLIGDAAKQLHTGRSRNDQVALDLHLYLRHHILLLISQLCELNEVFMQLSLEHLDVIMPGYTHLQRAEPVRFSHHMMAYCQMFLRDSQRLMDCFSRVNISPLGAGALAGSGFPVDRKLVAKLLKFDDIYENSLDAVSDRDFIVEFMSCASLIMMHFSKLSEELILWSSQEFSFIELDDQFCTGSSMMPQKKNPDIAELARGKVGRVYGALMGLLTVLKGLPLAYNKDLQEDKEGLFDTVKTLNKTLSLYAPMLQSMKINKTRLKTAIQNDYANATQLANYLVSKNIPFREAHAITGKIVMDCLSKNILLTELSLATLQSYCPVFSEAVFKFLAIEQVVESHNALGGTAKKSVEIQITQAQSKLEAINSWLQEKMHC